MSSGLWPSSPRKTAITTILYFPAEEERVYIRKKQISINSTGHDLDAIFCNSGCEFHMEKTETLHENDSIRIYWQLATAMSLLGACQK